MTKSLEKMHDYSRQQTNRQTDTLVAVKNAILYDISYSYISYIHLMRSVAEAFMVLGGIAKAELPR